MQTSQFSTDNTVESYKKKHLFPRSNKTIMDLQKSVSATSHIGCTEPGTIVPRTVDNGYNILHAKLINHYAMKTYGEVQV
jgi:hypothetical protein